MADDGVRETDARSEVTAVAGTAQPSSGPESAAAAALFGERVELATRYATLLTTTGISHGLLGPREAPRVWNRHLLNCAALVEVLPSTGKLADVGSGAGLPGLVLAIARPGLRVTLIEPLERRVRWLESVRVELGLDNVTDRKSVV